MKFDNVYFINGTAYAGKSTMVKLLAETYNGVACKENYHDTLLNTLNSKEYPNLTYTRDLKDWAEFIRRTPDEYETWINGVTKECAKLEITILEKLITKTSQKIFVDTNIPIELLHEISDEKHVLIMLANPDISVERFFDRPDKEKQFLYQLLLKEKDPKKAICNFRECLKRINSPEKYSVFEKSGFKVITRDENRTVEETFKLVVEIFDL
jgi:nicotinamide riboside kinase